MTYYEKYGYYHFIHPLLKLNLNYNNKNNKLYCSFKKESINFNSNTSTLLM